jgi:hypothetical protein
MGREALCTCHWQGYVAEAKALLESNEIILRGAIRARIPRAMITAVHVDSGELVVSVEPDRLILELGAVEAGRWAKALLTPLPTLAEKLGININVKAFVCGVTDDQVLRDALREAETDDPKEAAVIVSVLQTPADLPLMLDVAKLSPHAAIWCVYAKGTAALVGDSIVRTFMRSHGYLDNKTSAVSDRLTATRYRLQTTP